MTSESTVARRSAELVHHLERFPEDLCDIRRLQRQFALTTTEVASARWAVGIERLTSCSFLLTALSGR